MSTFCVPPELAAQLKEKVKGTDIAKLFEMDSQGRRDFWATHVDRENARLINTEFEKAMAKNRASAMKAWAQRTFNSQPTQSKSVIDQINKLKEDQLLNPSSNKAFLEDLVAQKLGLAVNAQEAAKISDIADKIKAAKDQVTRIGDPTDNPKAQLDYFKARKQMDDYVKSLNPSHNLAIVTSTIARGNLLFRISSVLLNIGSNTGMGALEMISRRLETRSFKGQNSSFGLKYMQHALNIYTKTGFDITRTLTLEADRKLKGEDVFNTQGKGAIRAVGRFYEDNVFQKTQGTPDVFASSIAFSDRADIEASKLAKAMGLKGAEGKAKAFEILKDSMTIEPKTKEGQFVRDSAVADAEYATFQNKSAFAQKSMELRKVLNVGDLRFGDMAVPFVKTTANAISASLDASGVTVPVKGVANMIQAVKLIQGDQSFISLVTKGHPEVPVGQALGVAFKGYSRTLIRAGLGVTAAYLLANALNPDNFIGEYPVNPTEQQLLKLQNATPNSIKINGHWISTDYFTSLAAPFIGFMYAKKYGKDLSSAMEAYVLGAGYQSTKIPGLDVLAQTFSAIQNGVPKAGTDFATFSDNLKKEASHYAVQFFAARAIPGLVGDTAKVTDTVNRDTSRKTDNFADIKSTIPGLREQLPAQKNVFGDTTQTEGWKTFIFGGRVKTAKDDPIIQELVRLDANGALPSITDITSTSKSAGLLKQQIGDAQYQKFVDEFRSDFKSQLLTTISDPGYKAQTDDEKKYEIDKLKTDTYHQYLDYYGYTPPDNPNKPVQKKPFKL